MKAVEVRYINGGKDVHMWAVNDNGVNYKVWRHLNAYGNHYWRMGVEGTDRFALVQGFRKNRKLERAYRLYIKRNDIKPKDKAPKHWGIKI